MRVIVLILCLIGSLQIGAQETGSIVGKLTDKEANDEPLAFANIIIKGSTKGTTSDFDGLYELADLEPGTYVLVFSYLGYQNVEIPDVKVEAGKVTTVNVPMSASEGVSLDEVVVTTQARRDSETALLIDTKKALIVKESIGNQQLRKLGVRDAATATTKISGVTSSEGSGDIFVRGLGDRYLSTTLNGLPVPSDDVERKNIDLGLFSTRVIQNVSISKTYAVAGSADQASGNVDITSRELKDTLELSVGVRVGGNTNVLQSDVFNNFSISPNSRNVDFGFYKQNLSTQELITQQGFNTVQQENPINYSYSITAGKRFGEKFGVLLTASQSQSYEYGQGVFRQYDRNFITDTITDATTSNKRNVTTALLDLSYRIDDNNKIKSNTFFVNTLSDIVFEGGRNGEASIFEETERPEGLFQFIRDQNLRQTSLFVTQLLGTHRLNENNLFKWAVGYNLVNADEPNRIRNEVNFDPNGTFVQLGRTGDFQQRKSNQEIDDTEYNGYLKNVSTLLSESNDEGDITKLFKLEYGLNYRNKQRDFRSQFVGVRETTRNAINPVSIDDLGGIFQQENFDSGALRLNILQPDFYNGELQSYAGFVDANYTVNQWNFNLGLRYQRDEIDVNFDVGNLQGRVGETSQEYDNLYPSLNVKYSLNEKNIFRFGFSRTITLPEFKEIAPFEYVSPTAQVVRGNPDIEASRDLNYDLKWEFYPSAGQVLSLAAFYKDISDPINTVQDRGSAGVFSFFNSGDKAEVFGLELETRVDLIKPIINEDDGSRSGYGLNLNLNATRMWHSQDLREIRNADGSLVRTFRYRGLTKIDLQGASDWILNANLNFTTANKNPWTLTVAGNYASDKIFALGAAFNQNNTDIEFNDAIVEKGFVVLDAVVSKEVGDHWTFRLTGRNLLNPEIERTQLIRPSTTGIQTEEVVRSYTNGAQISLGVNYNF
ncbi:TonB-dependent receptor [Spongiimicrobium salis]|uniref:TonB-dependent receptor n=1 Tax=Spongiimicrobium salis TaxID=1667022 RepID=UPI00374DDECC